MRYVWLITALAAGRLEAQARGAELFLLMNREPITKSTGTTRLQWLPGGGYMETGADSATGGRAFYRVDPVSHTCAASGASSFRCARIATPGPNSSNKLHAVFSRHGRRT